MFRIILALMFISTTAFPCTSFQLKGSSTFVGKSYDWRFGDGYVIYNPSALEKYSLTLKPGQKKISWTSQYASLTYNQYGLDFPNGGINEEGLTVEVLWLDTSIFPLPDEKPILNELQWIQYALDTQKTTLGVIATLEKVRIEPVYAKVHYFVCDKTDDCATLEFVNGKLVVGDYQKTGFEVITNNTLKESFKYLTQFKNFGGKKEINWESRHSLDRFTRINELIRVYKGQEPISYAFNMLNKVLGKKDDLALISHTQWQIVHDKEKLETHFKTTFGNNDIASVSMYAFPTHCGNRYYFDLDNPIRGDINKEFNPITYEANYNLVKKTLLKVMPLAPEDMVQAIASAPFKFNCIQ
jgi:penicillin V acylase-like amidase (Ntn superfamily)